MTQPPRSVKIGDNERGGWSSDRPRRAGEPERPPRARVRGRYRPGPARYRGSPGMPVSEPFPLTDPRLDLRSEVEIIARALQERGSANRRELSRRVGARFWGPGRFSAALREAVVEGRAKRLRGGEYAPAAEAPATATGPPER